MSRSLRSRRRRPGRGRPRNKALLAIVVLLTTVVIGALGAVGYVLSIAQDAPPLAELKPVQQGSISRIYAANGKPLGVIQANELRQPVRGDLIPKSLKDATVAIEDERFYKHHGVDYPGILRAAVKNAEEGRTVEGGSTVTQQLVRNLYITPERTYQRKIKEAKLAEELEEKHTKKWVLSTYLNTVPYGTAGGQSAIGARAAARIYFDKPVQKLTLGESALLAGLPQAPTDYSPFRAPKEATQRRNEVLRKMQELGMVTPEQARAAIAKPIRTRESAYFTRRRERYFFDYVKDELIKEYGAPRVRQGGLRVYTTIDLEKQKQARAAIRERLAGAGPSSAIVTIDPKNGYIKTMASSADYGQSQFNLAAQGQRQPGSAFKPMALMTALRRGVDPNSTTYVSRSPTVISSTPWGPIDVKTYGGKGAGTLNLVQATLKSDNSVYIQLALDLGPPNVKQTARDMGIKSTLKGYPAETLGGLERGVSPLEMANAYATIASGGYRNRPTAIKRIVFADGTKQTPRRFRVKRTKAFQDGATAVATSILEKNIQSGTGGRASIGCPAAGKTGTTDDNKNAWFVGFTPRLATAVWVGYPKANIPMRTEFGGGPVDGGTFPAEIWGTYMKKAKGRFCGGFKSPTQPVAFSRFDGKYTGGKGLAPGGKDDELDTGRPAPQVQVPTGAGTRRRGNGGYDPGQYEAAPQGEPDTQKPPDTDPTSGAAPGDT